MTAGQRRGRLDNRSPTRRLALPPRDQADAALIREVRPRPLHEHDDAVAEPGQLEDVDEEPEHPRHPAGELNPAQISHGRGAADGGKVPGIAEPEGGSRLVPEGAPDPAAGGRPLP